MLLEFPFEYVEITGLGRLFYPIVSLGLLTTSFGVRKFDFLVDTGADVTTIPLVVAKLLGIDPAGMPRGVAIGVGGVKVLVYETVLTLHIGDEELRVKANIVDGGTALLLGKKDVFEDKFSLIIDSILKKTVLKRN